MNQIFRPDQPARSAGRAMRSFGKISLSLALGAVAVITVAHNIAQSQTAAAIINSLNPSSATVRPVTGKPVTVTVSGTGLSSTSGVHWVAPNGIAVNLPATLVQDAQVAATIPASLLTTIGTAQLAVSDPTGTLSNQLPFSITAAGLTVSGGALPNATASVAYSQTLQAYATGGGQPYTWSLIGGSLPKGLTLQGSGTIAGTPSVAGGSAFTLRATDSLGAFQSAGFTLTVVPGPLTVPAISLPNAIATAAYPVQVITATGGAPPYTSYAITAGSLPAGLSFDNGQISGTPTTAGSSSFTVTVTDSAGTTASNAFTLAVQPTRADLVLGANSESFALSTGASGLPSGFSVPVRSSSLSQILRYTAALAQSAAWLDVTAGSGATPDAVGIALDPSALLLSAGNYQASVVVTCVAPSPCAGNAQTIQVSLVVSSPSPQLSLSTSLLSFAVTGANPTSVSQPLGLQNTGGGIITINFVSTADPWVTVTGTPATLPAGPATQLTVTANPSGLSPGYHQSTITVTSSAGSATVGVGLYITAAQELSLSPAGTQFIAGGIKVQPAIATGSFLVSVTGTSIVNWTAETTGAGWLHLQTTSGSSNSAAPGVVNFSVDVTDPSAAAAQTYYGTIRIRSKDVANPVTDFSVVLDVPVKTNLTLSPQPSGLVVAGTGALPPQFVQLFTNSASPISYQASATDPTILSVSPTTGTVSQGSPSQSTITIASGLKAGVYAAAIKYADSSSKTVTLPVTVIVPGAAGSIRSLNTPNLVQPAATCAPSKLVLAPAGLADNFEQPTAWPTPLSITLLDNCANALPTGQVVVTFSNGDPPLALQPVDSTSGRFSATWTPRKSSRQVTVAAQATAPSFAAATLQFSGVVTSNPAPVLTPGGTLNVFGAAPGAPLAPGMIVQIYGSNMAPSATGVPASTVPLTTSLGNTSVIMGGIPAPLYYVSPGQINAQVPFELAPGTPYQLLVNANNALSTPADFQVAFDSPGIAQFANGQIITDHADLSLVTDDSPAAPGEYVTLWVAGLGQTVDTVASGQASPVNPLPSALDQPTLTLNGQSIAVAYAGLTPTSVGLYQINFQIPANTPNGDLTLVVKQSGGQASVILPVHN